VEFIFIRDIDIDIDVSPADVIEPHNCGVLNKDINRAKLTVCLVLGHSGTDQSSFFGNGTVPVTCFVKRTEMVSILCMVCEI
jgi:hypothetical protein